MYINMEDSSIEAKCVYWCENNDIDEYDHNITNISQLSKYVTNYNFGDIVAFSEYRDTCSYIIGKDGELVGNPDYSNSGYLTIPYEITQYLDNAVDKYTRIEKTHIDLRHDDKFIKKNINTSSCKIKEKWNWKLTLYGYKLFVKFPDGKIQSFDVKETSAYKIKKWNEASQKSQSKLEVFFRVSGKKYDDFQEYSKGNKQPKIPSTWSRIWNGGGVCYKESHDKFTYEGPSDEEEKVIKSIEKYYNGYDVTINKLKN